MPKNRGGFVSCPECAGHGVVAHYSARDFEGADPCPVCGGGGVVWQYPSGRLAKWRGGPLLGSTPAPQATAA